jgi:hypothetical protein
MSKQQQSTAIEAIPEADRNEYVLEQYRSRIDYYWLLSASKVIEGWGMEDILLILAPVLAAVLTIVGGFSQNFHWGSAWREMVLTALELERIYHRLKVTPDEQRDPIAEMEKLHEVILAEGSNFFDRLVGVASKEELKQLDAIKPGNSTDGEQSPKNDAAN